MSRTTNQTCLWHANRSCASCQTGSKLIHLTELPRSTIHLPWCHWQMSSYFIFTLFFDTICHFDVTERPKLDQCLVSVRKPSLCRPETLHTTYLHCGHQLLRWITSVPCNSLIWTFHIRILSAKYYAQGTDWNCHPGQLLAIQRLASEASMLN